MWFDLPVSVILAVALLAAPVRAAPPDGRHAFRTFGLNEGLTSLAPLCLTQDRRGVLWVGTESGLFSYDGQRFTRYGQREGLPSSNILQLEAAPDGAVWVGTESGLARLEGSSASVITSVPASPIESISVAPDGCTWVCEAKGQLLRSCAGGPFAPAPGWPGTECTTAVSTPDGSILAAVKGGLEVRHPDGRWEHQGADLNLDGGRVDALLLDHHQRLWARSLDGLSMRPTPVAPFQRVNGVARAYLSGRLTEAPDGELWVPSVLGLARWKDGSWSLLDEHVGLPTTSVTVAFIDAEGSPWIGGYGLHRWLDAGEWSSFTTREGLPSDVIWAIRRDPAGTLWVGTDEGLAYQTSTGWAKPSFAEGLGIKAIALAPDGSLWAGSTGPHLFHWSQDRGELVHYTITDGLRGKQVTSVLAEADGTVLIATEAGGLLSIAPGELEVHPVDLPSGSPTETFRSLVVDREQRVWAGGTEGLAVRERGQWRRFTTADGLLQNFISYLCPRADGTVLLASWEALGYSTARLEHGQLTLTHDRRLEGRKIYFLAEDPLTARRFIGTGSGLEILEGSQRRHLGQSDGLPGDDLDANAVLIEPDGAVWVGTSTGLAGFHPGRARGAPRPPRSLIEAAQLGARPVDPVGRAEVEHVENTLEVHFAGLSFVDERKVNYGWRLLGLDPAWRESAVPEVRFTNLAPGAYSFEVRSRFDSGEFGPPALLHFTIRPAFWQTRWFAGLCALALAALIASAMRWRQVARRSARALSESEALMRSVFSVMGEGVLVLDEDGHALIWNASAEQILGLTPAQMRGLQPLSPDWKMLREDGTAFPDVETPHVATRLTGVAQRGVILGVRALDGVTRWLSVSSEPLRRAEGGGRTSVVATFTDVTELRAATRRATEANELKSQFVANMSHELRTPLNAVLVLSRLALEERSPEKLQEYLTTVQRSGEGLLSLVNDILDFSKVEAGKLTLERLPFALGDQLREIAHTFEPMFDARHLRFSLHFEAGVPEAVVGDPLRVRQVLTNLLSNAIKFTEQGFVTVTVTTHPGQVLAFDVRDSGIGISSAQQERLFTVFSQADATTTRRFGGTGLGLAISRSLARAMGGDLVVASSLGQGACFTFTCVLPAADADQARKLSAAHQLHVPSELAGRRALLVEDNKVNQLVARVLLEKAGMQVTLAHDGYQGVQAVLEAREPFDVVLMDVQMPVMDGYEATAELRQKLGARTPPIIALTANAMEEHREQSRRAGMDDHLSKPIDVDELYRVLLRVMEPGRSRPAA